jgi:ribonucleoside-triphosphate reductase (thioredoxin)
MNQLQQTVFVNTYARWDPEKGRRETWHETVDRVIGFFQRNVPRTEGVIDWEELRRAMLNQDALPSMRIIQMAGPPLERCNVGAYNCAYVPLDCPEAFAELLYILMQGTGCGFSVESRYTDNLGYVAAQSDGHAADYIIPDTTEGWCDALLHGIYTWITGGSIEFDYSQIRPAGTPLKTKGGWASGPEPLRQLLEFTKSKIRSRVGQKLRPIDCHDIATFCGQIVQVGGVRRRAEISLSDLDDREMRDAKSGQFWANNPQRTMANNSAVYEAKPDVVTFMEEWMSLVKSGTGERGIFNREGIIAQLPARRDPNYVFGMNPCAEVVMRPKQFCNLSMAVARPGDDLPDLHRKVRLATIFGTLQSTLTDFGYLRPAWQRNCEEERLLGVDIAGQMDNVFLQPDALDLEDILNDLRQTVIYTNHKLAEQLGIPASAATTCVKPSGNSSQFLDCSSGIHPRFAPYYIRRIRLMTSSPVAALLQEAGVPYQKELTTDSVLVFEFPVEAPHDAIFRRDLSALDHLEHWLTWKREWCEHNPSCTIYVEPDEWLEVGNWVYEHWDDIGGLSFLPKDNTVYPLAPYEEITRDTYLKLNGSFPQINFDRLAELEKVDRTEVNRDYACVGGACEI